MRLCDARHLYLFLTRLADNSIGDEGARVLAEPLGKLTALERLDLSSTLPAFLCCCVRCGAMCEVVFRGSGSGCEFFLVFQGCVFNF